MRAQVDPDKCQGHARCFLIAPQVFNQDEQGHAYTSDEDIPSNLHEQVREAERNCPETAISVSE